MIKHAELSIISGNALIRTSVTRKFRDLMSQCMYPLLCRKAMAFTASRTMRRRRRRGTKYASDLISSAVSPALELLGPSSALPPVAVNMPEVDPRMLEMALEALLASRDDMLICVPVEAVEGRSPMLSPRTDPSL